ncbi:hypothetical protein ONS95_005243 [Cadophora gregata]|uniref:uncharacterized protein n=1 Tax=Cadophora gregata TaxID=51156 RepID=UPI0026DBF003|nr:uncharacterized protein ONS95_005243 [Cadophora gregata]KAK0103209.1 hypothetical protein ONS95_005243 [Cadophora gregata]
MMLPPSPIQFCILNLSGLIARNLIALGTGCAPEQMSSKIAQSTPTKHLSTSLACITHSLVAPASMANPTILAPALATHSTMPTNNYCIHPKQSKAPIHGLLAS